MANIKMSTRLKLLSAPESPPSEINSEVFFNMDPDSDLDSPVENEFEPQALGTDITPVAPGYACPITNYFTIATQLCLKKACVIPLPLCMFSVNNNTAIHLAYDPSIWWITINDAAERYGLPDLYPF